MSIVTALACWWGPPQPYRLGEILPNDVRVRTYFEVINQPETELAREQALQRLPAGQATDKEARAIIRQTVPPVVERYTVDTPLVHRGEPIALEQLMLLREESRAHLHGLTRSDQLRRGAALFLVVALLAGVVVLYVARFQQTLAESLAKVAGICLLVVLTFFLAVYLSAPPWHAVLVPLTLAAMMLTIAYNAQFALLMSFCLALATTLALGLSLDHLMIQMAGLAQAVLLLRNVRTRTRLVQVGFTAGLAFFAMTVAVDLLSGQAWRYLLSEAGRNLVWGSLAGFILTGILPVVERCFGVITDVSLLELGDGSHPLLQELIRRAPGTYTHSMAVATLAETAAEAIGANPLLARVGSYFHDVGKMLKPQYFIENQAGENRHDTLEPALSTLVIIGHIKDGLALARQYRLPQPVVDFIDQHHGTTLVEYFYREAVRMQEESGQPVEELEASFRYPGPKPQSRETGIVMLADAAESSSRAMKEPAPNSLRKLVRDLLMKRLLDGQFEESDLTLTELHVIEESLSKSLIALCHSRIRYPDDEELVTSGDSREASEPAKIA
ncbi:MAG TPA: HDIG domain-containing protein [Gemmataceae bacterium]|nr:HDIG domain-containing protein [Gemmataceae bacterium]